MKKGTKKMPMVNYCRKCKTQTPLGETCPYCGGKLTQTGEQVSFGVIRVPLREWFAWNNVLRIALPVWLLVLVAAVVAEACATGADGVAALFTHGFFWTMMAVLGVMLFLILILLLLQGPEKVHYVLDKDGVHARTYLPKEAPSVRLYARFLTPQAVERIEDERQPLEGLVLVRRVSLPWSSIRRVRIWTEGSAVLFFRPTFWQTLAIRCPAGELEQTEAYARKKLKRFQKVRVLPVLSDEKKKKR